MNNIIFEASVQDGKIEIPEAYREAMQQATIVQIKLLKKGQPMAEPRHSGPLLRLLRDLGDIEESFPDVDQDLLSLDNIML